MHLRRMPEPKKTFSNKVYSARHTRAVGVRFSHNDKRLERAVRQQTGFNFFASLYLSGRPESPVRSYNVLCLRETPLIEDFAQSQK